MVPVDRRSFGAILPALAAAASGDAGAAALADPEQVTLAANGAIPNNPLLPVLLYRGVLPGPLASADGLERRLRATGWPAQWRNGIFDFHHYHSTAHEVLGVVGGAASVFLGGPGARTVTVRCGDLMVLPTGTGHCLDRASDDFLVVGAYPDGQHWDICRTPPDAAATARMAALLFPHTDPIGGANGALPRLWV